MITRDEIGVKCCKERGGNLACATFDLEAIRHIGDLELAASGNPDEFRAFVMEELKDLILRRLYGEMEEAIHDLHYKIVLASPENLAAVAHEGFQKLLAMTRGEKQT
jgi:hypothetical protein